MRKKQTNLKTMRTRVYSSLLLVLLALVAVTAATVAWFSIADNTRVRTMGLQIIADPDMRMDLDAHGTIGEYVKTLSFEQIAARIQKEKGFSMKTTPLKPVTTSDAKVFTYENGSTASDKSGSYLEFTLHFMAEKDMLVHLTSANSKDGESDGTAVTSKQEKLPEAMRISFTADGKTWVYNPGMGDTSAAENGLSSFGLPGAGAMKLSGKNALFSLKEHVDKPVVVRIWMEGTDPACTDELQQADYEIRLRFTGETEEENQSAQSE